MGIDSGCGAAWLARLLGVQSPNQLGTGLKIIFGNGKTNAW